RSPRARGPGGARRRFRPHPPTRRGRARRATARARDGGGGPAPRSGRRGGSARRATRRTRRARSSLRRRPDGAREGAAPSVQRPSVLLDGREAREDDVRVRRVGREREVATEIVARGAEALELRVQEAAHPDVLRGGRPEDEEEVDRLERLVVRGALEADAEQVAEHTDEDAGRVRRRERPRGDGVGVGIAERAVPLEQRVAVEPAAGVEGVDDDRPLRRGDAREEMTREPDAFDRDAEPRPHLDQDDGERDRNAEPPSEDLVEEAVPGVVVVLRVAAKAARPEEVRREGGPGFGGRGGARNVRPRVGGERVERGEGGCDVELRRAEAADRERGAPEVDRRRDERRELVAQAAHRGSQSSTTLPSGSRSHSCASPSARYGTPRASSSAFAAATHGTSSAKCGPVGSMPPKPVSLSIRCTWLAPTSYQAPGRARSGRGAGASPSRSS